MAIIQADRLVKKYKTSFSFKKMINKRDFVQQTTAIDGLSFTIDKPMIYGILGPNGAGKTTLIKILATILLPDGGNLEILGYELPKEEKKLRESIGLSLGEYERTFQWRLTGRQNLEFFAGLYGLPKQESKKKIDELLSRLGLETKADTIFLEYSTGMKHKLALARALLNDPELLLFDEPTAGLDVQTSEEVAKFTKSLTKKGKTIVYTSHRLEEAGDLCDRILILDEGRKIAEETPKKIRELACEIKVIQVELNTIPDSLLSKIQSIDGVEHVYLIGPTTLRIHCYTLNNSLYPLLSLIKSESLEIKEIYSCLPTMKDAFLKLTGA